jgi:DNA-directed RNA polymerase specialized sigma24 family protein
MRGGGDSSKGPPVGEFTDDELLHILLTREHPRHEDAWGHLMNDLAPAAVKIVASKMAISPLDDAAIDVASELLERLLDDDHAVLRRWRRRGKLLTYLSVITYNFTIDHIRSQRSRRRSEGAAAHDAFDIGLVRGGSGAQVEACVEAAEYEAVVVADSPNGPRNWAILCAFEMGGMTAAEIAASPLGEGLTAKGVQTIVNRARRLLRSLGRSDGGDE